MSCGQCQGIEALFDSKKAARDLHRYRESGPWKTTRILIDALRAEGAEGMTLLDIGGGVGAIQHELLEAGATKATSADGSAAYMEAAQDEAQRRGLAGRVVYHHGDFVGLAGQITSADIVTLDRVICCYHDMPGLVGLSAAKAGRVYGLVYPRDRWWMKLAFGVMNLVMKLVRNPFRAFVHSARAVDAVVRAQGLEPASSQRTALWEVVLYRRGEAS